MVSRNIAIIVAAAVLGVSACAGGNARPAASPGSYTPVAATDEQVIAAAAFAIDAQRRVMAETGDPATLELVSVMAAEQQVVAGLNYRLTLRVRRDGVGKIADAVVWWQAWRQPDPYRLTAWEWQ